MPLTKVPYDLEGNMLESEGYWTRDPSKVEYKPNAPFQARLKFDKEIGYNSVKYQFEDVETGVKYPLWHSEFMNIVRNYPLEAGGVTPLLTWVAQKRGQALSLVVVENA